MDFEQMKKKLGEMLKEKRYIHSIGVCETAVHLAEKYGADTERARIAGLLHDAAKNVGKKEMYLECERLGVELDELERTVPSLVHSKLGAAYVREKFGIDDEQIINAVRYHTTGCADMTLLERIIYIADMIEPNRSFDGVDKLRKVTEKDLDEGCILGLSYTISHTINEGGLVHPDTVVARNSLIIEKERKKAE